MTTKRERSTAAATLGRKGGAARTPAKKAASAANGRKGGRPATLRAITRDEADRLTIGEGLRAGSGLTPSLDRATYAVICESEAGEGTKSRTVALFTSAIEARRAARDYTSGVQFCGIIGSRTFEAVAIR